MTSKQTLPDLRKVKSVSLKGLFCLRKGETGVVQLIYVRVEDAVDETDAGAFVGVLVGEFNVDFPETAGEGG